MHPRFRDLEAAALTLLEAADHAARAAGRAGRRAFPRRKRGLILHPGDATPLWNLLVQRANRHLQVRGRKAHLGRLLGLPRQRINDCLKARTACLDAERTLMLLCWVAGRDQGRRFSVPDAPP